MGGLSLIPARWLINPSSPSRPAFPLTAPPLLPLTLAPWPAQWPRTYTTTFVLAEEDFGGVADYISALVQLVQRKIDAAIGAAAGAILGATTSRDKVKGGLIGAAVGGILGGVIGNNVDIQHKSGW